MRASIPLLLLFTACVMTMTPRANTREGVRAYVDRAAKVMEREGADACNTFGASDWIHGDWYIFVLDADGRTLCHPARPEMVGTMAHALVDARGTRFGDEFVRVAGSGGGWVSYLWARPGETETVEKLSYVRQATGPDGKTYVLGSGGYALR